MKNGHQPSDRGFGGSMGRIGVTRRQIPIGWSVAEFLSIPAIVQLCGPHPHRSMASVCVCVQSEGSREQRCLGRTLLYVRLID